MDGLDIAASRATANRAGYRHSPPPVRLRSRIGRNSRAIWFFFLVVLPTAASAVYLFGYAADQYVSEARFVVRGQPTQSPGMLSSLLQGAGVSRAQDDTYAVQDFMESRDAAAELIKTQGLKDVYNRPEADILSKFPQFWHNDSFERFYKFYQDHVSVVLDSTTGVSTMQVKAFRPEDAQRVTKALLVSAENLVNRMNDRQRENSMRDARKEVLRAEEKLQGISAQIAEFRNREAILDPNKQSIPMLQGIVELQTLLSRVNLQITQLTVSSPKSPLIGEYQRRAQALQAQIDQAKTKITGGDQSLVPKIAAFEMLTLQRDFADRELASATTSLEAARMQADRQQLYLDLIVQPNLADDAAYPKRFVSVGIVFATTFGVYLMLSLLVAGAREHHIV